MIEAIDGIHGAPDEEDAEPALLYVEGGRLFIEQGGRRFTPGKRAEHQISLTTHQARTLLKLLPGRLHQMETAEASADGPDLS